MISTTRSRKELKHVIFFQAYPERNPEPLFGQRQRFSPYDIEEINYLYSCGKL